MRALISVYDKSGLVEFAAGLVALDVELVASGNTAEALRAAGIAHVAVEDVTGAPEMLEGRVKTLHPSIHAGILADRSKPEHLAELTAEGITPIDLVVSNLYPFVAAPSIETIDIGGPAMVRAAAKNHEHVAVVTHVGEYPAILDELRANGAISFATRRRLARTAFAHIAAYDAAIVTWFDDNDPDVDAVLPPTIHLALERAEELRYGENPHQSGARYRRLGATPGFWEGVVQGGGRELSYLNLVDAEAAWRLVHELLELPDAGAAAVVVKHANPCGAAIGSDLSEVYERAFAGDPVAAFGGIVALSGPVDLALATQLVARPLADVLIAPSIDEDAQELFARRRKNMRPLIATRPDPLTRCYRQIAGGFLVQEPDRFLAPPSEWQVLTGEEPTAPQLRDAALAQIVCGRTLSNAIVLAKDGDVVGVGCGQQSRVDAAALAVRKAGDRARGAVAASDAYFPFRDGVDVLIEAGVRVVVQPGGSIRDEEVGAAARGAGVTMLLSGERHFRH
jgi:phosphoribosylaminoimidazolecarboxamide formyltransferase/IMP cyclohydrolase